MNMRFEFPAVKGRQGDRDFFMASIPFSVLGRLLEIDAGNPLQRSQRVVDEGRARAIVEYFFQNHENYVLPSLTGVVEDTSLEFKDVGGGAGVLSLKMDAIIKLFDGQHRATAITSIAKSHGFRSKWEDQTIGVQLFVGMTLPQRQQAFSDINSKAKAVSKSLNLAYDVRDKTTAEFRHYAELVFGIHVDYEKNIATKGEMTWFSFKHVVDAFRLLCGLKAKDQFTRAAGELIMRWFNHLELRRSCGWNHGHKPELISRTALGLLALTRVFNYAHSANITPDDLAVSLAKLDFNRENPLWLNVCVDAKGRMIANPQSIKATARKILEACEYTVPTDCPALQ